MVFISSASFSSHSSRVLAYTFLDRDFSIECYKVAKKTPDGIDYEITIDGKNGYVKERLGATVDRMGTDALEAAIATDDLITRKDDILAKPLLERQ